MEQHLKYFKILGIAPTSDLSEIKKAYRKNAMRFHPDKNTSIDAEAQFIKITEAYEIIIGLQKKPLQRDHSKSADQVRAEKIKEAKSRYKKMQESELEKDAQYYQKITNGYRWIGFKFLAYYSFFFMIILTVDYFFTSHKKAVPEITIYGLLPSSIKTGGEIFQIHDPTLWKSKFPPTQQNYGLCFKDLKSVSIIDEPLNLINIDSPSDKRKRFFLFENYTSQEFYSYASVYYTFPFFHVFLFLPLFLIRFKRPTINFSIGRLVSLWVIFPSVIYLSFANGRILHFFGLL